MSGLKGPEGDSNHSTVHYGGRLPELKIVAMAPPPIPVTTVLITPTAHSRVERGGVISHQGCRWKIRILAKPLLLRVKHPTYSRVRWRAILPTP